MNISLHQEKRFIIQGPGSRHVSEPHSSNFNLMDLINSSERSTVPGQCRERIRIHFRPGTKVESQEARQHGTK